MRINANPSVLAVRRSDADLKRIAGAGSLAIARLEPVFTRREQGAFALDLIFARGGEIAVVPAIRVAHEMLLEPECSPFIWPQCARNLEPSVVDEIEALLAPWLCAHALAGQMNDEMIRRFSDTLGEQMFADARKASFLGAAPYRDVAAAAAPYVYAMRFAKNARIGVRDGLGATGAALLAATAQSTACDLGEAGLNELAARWFGATIFEPLTGSYDVGIGTEGQSCEIRFDESGNRIVHVATPVPSEFFVSFDTEDAPPCRTFSVTCKAQTALRTSALAPAPPAVGGSGGRILLLLGNSAPNELAGQSDDANELARRLRAEGFEADVFSASSVSLGRGYDLIHAFDVARDPQVARVLHEARSRDIPIVASAGLTDATGEWAWASAVVNALMRSAADETTLHDHLRMMSLRRLNTDQSGPVATEPVTGYGEAVRAALTAVDVLLVGGPHEERIARDRHAYRGMVRTVPAYLSGERPAPSIDELCGTWDFVLAHTPILPAANLFLLARAAQDLDLPLVIAGPVADSLYFAYVREALDGRVIFVPHPSPEELGALYLRGRVFADVSWWQTSLNRAARAAVSGCHLVLARGSNASQIWGPHAAEADPSDVGSIRAALRDAWDRPASRALAEAAARQCDPGAAFLETVTAYAQAQTAKAVAVR